MAKALLKRTIAKVFRKLVHNYSSLGAATLKQGKFELTLAEGLNASLMFQDKERYHKMKVLENIDVFPDRQVVAMTAMEPTALPL